jgi:hypothetical protein
MCLSDLLTTYPDLPVDVIWTLLSTGRLFTNLAAVLLMNHDQVMLYEEEVKELGEVASTIKTFYNLVQRHSSLEYVSPVAFEQQKV